MNIASVMVLMSTGCQLTPIEQLAIYAGAAPSLHSLAAPVVLFCRWGIVLCALAVEHILAPTLGHILAHPAEAVPCPLCWGVWCCSSQSSKGTSASH